MPEPTAHMLVFSFVTPPFSQITLEPLGSFLHCPATLPKRIVHFIRSPPFRSLRSGAFVERRPLGAYGAYRCLRCRDTERRGASEVALQHFRDFDLLEDRRIKSLLTSIKARPKHVCVVSGRSEDLVDVDGQMACIKKLSRRFLPSPVVGSTPNVDQSNATCF